MNYTFVDGDPLPLGCNVRKKGVNFAVYAQHANYIGLLLFRDDTSAPQVSHNGRISNTNQGSSYDKHLWLLARLC